MNRMEETPFTESHKVKVKSQEANRGRRKKLPSCCKNATSYFCNFCDNTSIHGFKFFGELKRNIFEKLFWLLIINSAIIGAGFLIYNAYSKWVASPIVVTFAMTETPIWKIPFPAVTICPETNANPVIFNYTDVYLKYWNKINTTEEEDEFFKLFSLVCNDKLEFINENETKFISDDKHFEFIMSFAYPGFANCKWLGNEIDCDDSLQDSATNEGLCRTFNMLTYDDVYVNTDEIYQNRTLKNTELKSWSLEGGYPSTTGLDAFPRRTMISGVNGGLQIDFEVNEHELDYLCTDLQGYKVTLHHPAEEPDMDKYFRVPLDQVVVAAIRPSMITTTDEITSYKAEDRQCYVPGEKVLATFKIYSQQNCLNECMLNFTIFKCGCTPFYNPTNDPTCGAGSKRCTNKAKIEFLQREVNAKMQNKKGEINEECNCLPACTSIEFDAETSQTDWNWKKAFELNPNKSELDVDYFKNMRKSRLLVYYKDLQFMTSERHELYGTIDFLANCGGLLGLCCGFSFTSLMEIIYYLTLRLISNVHKFGCKLWSGSEELIEEDDDDDFLYK